ncbi:type III-B CRISPR module RAMP protein Cmr4 [bacterium]|nr:type III-B CRISPR module RAMP protein Cmr4 [bacterium]
MSGTIAFMRALTSTHLGAGTGIGAIDLPIQREKHTQWPMNQGGGMKGVFRDQARRALAEELGTSVQQADSNSLLTCVFGPPVESAGEHAGALAVSDARILLFPVRSIKGVFALVTCPAVLERFGEDCVLAGINRPSLPQHQPTMPENGRPSAYAPSQAELFFPAPQDDQDGGYLAVLEDLSFKWEANTESPNNQVVVDLANALAAYAPAAKDRLVIVPDDVFSYFVQFRTEVVTRNALDYEKKTVRKGALFNEEFLPPETVLYSVLLVDRDHQTDGGKTADDKPAESKGANALLTKTKDWIHGRYLQFGGDASTGKGLCHVSFFGGTWTGSGGGD